MTTPPKKSTKRLFSRRNFISTAVLAPIGGISYAHWLEPNYLSVTCRSINIPNLPKALDGTVIAHLTDIHYQPEYDYNLMLKVVEAVQSAKPDIIALTGDFVCHDAKVLPPLMEHLSQLRAQHGVYGIMGNHDGWTASPSFYKKAFNQAGFEFFINDGSRIFLHGEPLYLVGTDSIWSGTINLPACYRGYQAGDPVLALVHEPDVFDQILEKYPISLQLSGHTHGGQCRVPLINYAPAKVKYGKNYIYGEFSKLAPMNVKKNIKPHSQTNQSSTPFEARLFVSRGIGTTGARLRFACPPEVAILTLKSEESDT